MERRLGLEWKAEQEGFLPWQFSMLCLVTPKAGDLSSFWWPSPATVTRLEWQEAVMAMEKGREAKQRHRASGTTQGPKWGKLDAPAPSLQFLCRWTQGSWIQVLLLIRALEAKFRQMFSNNWKSDAEWDEIEAQGGEVTCPCVQYKSELGPLNPGSIILHEERNTPFLSIGQVHFGRSLVPCKHKIKEYGTTDDFLSISAVLLWKHCIKVITGQIIFFFFSSVKPFITETQMTHFSSSVILVWLESVSSNCLGAREFNWRNVDAFSFGFLMLLLPQNCLRLYNVLNLILKQNISTFPKHSDLF